MFKKKSFLFFVFVIFLFVISCSNLKKDLGLEKDPPNEFLVEKKSSLVLPPDYDILPPDSQSKKKSENKLNNSVKSIFDKNLEDKKENQNDKIKNSSNLENEILKEIK